MNYGGEKTKEEICSSCLKAFRNAGLSILDVDELKQWLREEKPEKIARVLISIGFSFCYYENEVDDIVWEKLKDLSVTQLLKT